MCDRFIVSQAVIVEMVMTVYYAIYVKYINNNWMIIIFIYKTSYAWNTLPLRGT